MRDKQKACYTLTGKYAIPGVPAEATGVRLMVQSLRDKTLDYLGKHSPGTDAYDDMSELLMGLDEAIDLFGLPYNMSTDPLERL